MTEDTDDDAEAGLDMAAIEHAIRNGAQAFRKLLKHKLDDWNSWTLTIDGLRALRDLAFARAHTNNINSQAYREEIGALLKLSKYAIYSQINKPTRSACYKLMDRLEDIKVWYVKLPADDQLRWKHPQSILKHAPRALVTHGQNGDSDKPKPKQKGKSKSLHTAEYERMRRLAIHAIKRLIKYEPDAVELLDQCGTPEFGEPDDRVDDLFPEGGRHLDA